MRVRLSNYLLVLLGLFLFAVAAQAATPQPGYPVPQIIGPTHPSAVVPGSLHFTLDVYGANFINGSVVNWNGSPRTTTFLSGHHLRAQINAADVVSPTSGFVTVTTNSPNGPIKSSTYAQVLVHTPTSGLTLGTSTQYIVLGEAAMLPGDLSGRNLLDLTVDSNSGNPGFTALVNNGDGTFQIGPQFANDYYGGGGGLGDFNGDGNLDLVYTEGPQSSNSLQMEAALGLGGGIFNTGAKFDMTCCSPPQLVVGDFNQDGILDVVTLNGYKNALFLGNGDGTFRQGQTLNIPDGIVSAADLNNDGKLDLVFSNANVFGSGLQFMLGNGDGTFQRARTVKKNVSVGLIFITDLNSDGNEDIVFSALNEIWVVRGNGDGTFRKAVVYPTAVGIPTVGDFNSDGAVDIGLVMTGGVDYMAGKGDGTFGTAQIVPFSGFFPTNAAVGDFNADGLLDLSISGNGINVFLQP